MIDLLNYTENIEENDDIDPNTFGDSTIPEEQENKEDYSLHATYFDTILRRIVSIFIEGLY